jgi:hypothetical protein
MPVLGTDRCPVARSAAAPCRSCRVPWGQSRPEPVRTRPSSVRQWSGTVVGPGHRRSWPRPRFRWRRPPESRRRDRRSSAAARRRRSTARRSHRVPPRLQAGDRPPRRRSPSRDGGGPWVSFPSGDTAAATRSTGERGGAVIDWPRSPAHRSTRVPDGRPLSGGFSRPIRAARACRHRHRRRFPGPSLVDDHTA